MEETNNSLAETEQARAGLTEEKVTTELKMVQLEEEKDGNTCRYFVLWGYFPNPSPPKKNK